MDDFMLIYSCNKYNLFGANPADDVLKSKVKDTRNLSSQSERAFKAIHRFSTY